MLTHGVPKDEIFLYEDALRKGRSLIIVSSESDERIEQARAIMDQEGAESVDAARKQWWIGLRDAEEADYDSPDGSFADIEATYRRGFEAALEPQCRGKAWRDAVAILRARHGALCEQDAFRRGYERGQAYLARWSGPGESRQQSLR